MTESGDECDLDTLSALLEECDDLPSADNASANGGKHQEEVTAEDIAAFFSDSFDSEHEGENEAETKDLNQETADDNQQRQQNEPESWESAGGAAEGDTALHSITVNFNQHDPEDMLCLKVELAMIKKREMEIQLLLASPQNITPAAVPVSADQSTTNTQSFTTKQQLKPAGFSKTSSTSSPSVVGLSRSTSKKKIISPSVSQSLRGPDKKPFPEASSSTSGTEKHKALSTYATGTEKHNVISTNASDSHKLKTQAVGMPLKESTSTAADSSRPLGSSGSKHQLFTVSQKSDSASKSSSTTRRKQTETVHPAQTLDFKKEGSSGEKKEPASAFLMDVAEKAEGKASLEGRSLKSELFGDADSDSDWEDEDGKKQQLSSSGQEIRRLLQQGQRQHFANVPSYTMTPATAAWKSRSVSSAQDLDSSGMGCGLSIPGSSGGNAAAGVKEQPDTKDYITDKFSGLRIINPKVSSAMLASKMEGRRLIALSTVHLKLKCPELQSDWVTIGVIVSKINGRKSKAGNTYSIWKLSDLQSTDIVVSFFLFGQVYKQLWKTDVGSIVGILNPIIMDSIEKGDEVAFTVKNAQQVMEIGRSKDLGWCLAKTKRGASCTKFINKKMGDFCTFHVLAAYRKQSAQRSELHGSCPGTTPRSFLKSKILQNNTFFYGGETFTAAKVVEGQIKDKVTLGKLQVAIRQKEQGKVNTLAIQNLKPEQAGQLQQDLVSQHHQPFLDMLMVPTAGSMNLVRHIAMAENKVQGDEKVKKGGKTTFQSVKASDLLKQHRTEISIMINSRKQQQGDKMSQHSVEQSQNSQGVGQPQTKQPSLSKHACSDKAADVPVSCKPAKKSSASLVAPVLGKGFYPGGKIDLFAESPASSLCKPTATDVAKKKAIQKVQAIGGLEKADPNAVRAATHNTENITKLVLENIENEHKKAEKGDGEAFTTGGQSSAEPPRKRSRLLGNVDPNSAEVKKLLSARSSHTGALAQAEAEREDRYFDNLEKKEMMEEKMKSITSVEVSVVTCEQWG